MLLLNTGQVVLRSILQAGAMIMRKWQCSICGFIYDESEGLPDHDIEQGTAWEDIPDDFSCPDCGVSKGHFEMVENT